MPILTAGRELDARVASELMGLEICDFGDGLGQMLVIDGMTDLAMEFEIPGYSTCIGFAWDVVDHMRAQGFYFEASDMPGETSVRCVASFYRTPLIPPRPGSTAVAATMPLAICQAALGIL